MNAIDSVSLKTFRSIFCSILVLSLCCNGGHNMIWCASGGLVYQPSYVWVAFLHIHIYLNMMLTVVCAYIYTPHAHIKTSTHTIERKRKKNRRKLCARIRESLYAAQDYHNMEWKKNTHPNRTNQSIKICTTEILEPEPAQIHNEIFCLFVKIVSLFIFIFDEFFCLCRVASLFQKEVSRWSSNNTNNEKKEPNKRLEMPELCIQNNKIYVYLPLVRI